MDGRWEICYGGQSVRKPVCILVEYQTEYRFVKDMLKPVQRERGTTCKPTMITTRHSATGSDRKGE